jgi:hypothetical protein
MHLVQHAYGSFTSDTIGAFMQLEGRVSKVKAKLTVRGRPQTEMSWEHIGKNRGPTGLRPEWSAVPTGREVYLKLDLLDDKEPTETRRERELALLWGLAVPLGFMPWNRYPLPGIADDVFHFFGPWSTMMDNLMGSGRGEVAWPAFATAAQCEVGRFEGPRKTERLVQAHLHRLGYNVGEIDGIIGNKTQGALKAAALHGLPLKEAAERLIAMNTPAPPLPKRVREGRLDLPEIEFSIHPFGQVRATRTKEGAHLHVRGTGRFVIDIIDS